MYTNDLSSKHVKNSNAKEHEGNAEKTSSNGVHLLYSDAFSRVAEKYNVVIGIRAPNPLGESLLREGYPSKNFHMKAKSSATGPTAGFITENPEYSKVAAEYELQNKQKKAIDAARAKGAKAVPLTISEDRIKELMNTGDLKCENGLYWADYPTGRKEFQIKGTGLVFDEQGLPVMVMTNAPEYRTKDKAPPPDADPKPITADYDLFTIIPRENQSNNVRPLTLPQKSLRKTDDFVFDKKFSGKGFFSPVSLPDKDEDRDMGNMHMFGQTIMKALNKEIELDGYKGGKLVWHNDETGNPFSPGLNMADKPIFIFPDGRIVQVHSINELRSLYNEIRKKGFIPEYSPIFGV
ncbi:anthrax toxin-like adenylyl cyclase domain-containing protein [Yokenella regensburgei]|uniref:anthrax toxin-like adenylyl cyclase domain-containing protein n=1 Tax=Yokenella regensburgei TaxID=158877 RepID=UPI003EDABB62